jgi:hypothetical protein
MNRTKREARTANTVLVSCRGRRSETEKWLSLHYEAFNRGQWVNMRHETNT